jgi:hypothetical protein
MKFSYYGFDLKVEVSDGQNAVNRLTPGKGYGHVVRTTEYHRLEDREIEVISSLDDTQQLEFKSGAAWTCKMRLESDDAEKDGKEILTCKAKIRPRDKITVSVDADPPLPKNGPQVEDLTIR